MISPHLSLFPQLRAKRGVKTRFMSTRHFRLLLSSLARFREEEGEGGVQGGALVHKGFCLEWKEEERGLAGEEEGLQEVGHWANSPKSGGRGGAMRRQKKVGDVAVNKSRLLTDEEGDFEKFCFFSQKKGKRKTRNSYASSFIPFRGN